MGSTGEGNSSGPTAVRERGAGGMRSARALALQVLLVEALTLFGLWALGACFGAS